MYRVQNVSNEVHPESTVWILLNKWNPPVGTTIDSSSGTSMLKSSRKRRSSSTPALSSRRRKSSDSEIGGQEETKVEKLLRKEDNVVVEEEWEVEEIVDHRLVQGKMEYFVKWMHWPSSSNTWEPPENLGNSKALISKHKRMDRAKKEYIKLMNGETGFNIGLICEAVTGVMQLENCPDPAGEKIFYIVKWENSSRIDRIPSSTAVLKIPQLVIKYWESITKWAKKQESGKVGVGFQKGVSDSEVMEETFVYEEQEEFDDVEGDENLDPRDY